MIKCVFVVWVLVGLGFGVARVAAEDLKRSIVVLNFEGLGVSEIECDVITERLRAELSRTERFLVTTKQQTALAVAKHKEIAELSQLLGVERALVGSVSKIGTTYSLVANLIDPVTGKTIKTVVCDHTGGVEGLLQDVIQDAAKRLANFEGTGYLAFVGPRGGDTIDHLSVWINGRPLNEFPKADFLLLTQVPEGIHTLKLEWSRPGINGRHPPYTVHVQPGKVVTVECNAIRFKPTLRVSQPVGEMSIAQWREFYWPELYPEKRYIRGKATSVVEIELDEAR